MKEKATVIGDGGWGTALAMVLQQNGNDVTVWGAFEENTKAAQATHRNEIYLPGVDLSPEIQWTSDPKTAAAGSDIFILASPTQYFRDVAMRFKGLIPDGATVASVAKGLDRETHQTMTTVAEDALGIKSVAALSGPSHAEEVARGKPTAIVVACNDNYHATRLQHIFSNNHFRVYTASDVLGIQLGGALKNVIAIAVGIADGMGLGDNTRAALITRGLAEISRLGIEMGCNPATFSGLSGMGDLVVTCTSSHSRNHTVGERLGRGETLDQIMQSMQQVAEGVWNCSNARALAHSRNIELPITEEVYEILQGNRTPAQAVTNLMERSLKTE